FRDCRARTRSSDGAGRARTDRARARRMARAGDGVGAQRLSREHDRPSTVAEGFRAVGADARLLSPGEGLLRDQLLAGAPAELGAGAAGRNLAHPVAQRWECFMSALSPEAYAIIEGRHPDPFHYLGPHVEADSPIVRVYLPDADEVRAVQENGRECELQRIHEAGLFAGRLENGMSQRYR